MTVTDQALDQAADVVESVGEVVTQQTEGVAEVVRSLNGLKLQYAFIGVAIGGAVGTIVGLKIAYKKAETKFDKIAREEVEEMRVHFYQKERAREEQTEKPDLDEVVQGLGYATKDAPVSELKVPGSPGVSVVDTGASEPSKTEINVNVFTEAQKGLTTAVWDHDREVASRSMTKPYVIHKEEFAEGHSSAGVDYEQATVTYYVEDDTLANAGDQRMDDIDETVGLENLEKFGHGSEDANVVYIRNDRLQVDFEVLRSGGSFTVEVLGIDEEPESDELRHSDMRRRRPQFDDD